MSNLIQDIYKLTASVSSEDDLLFELLTPRTMNFSLNLDVQPKDTDNVTVFWNFDDPLSSVNDSNLNAPNETKNEVISYSAINSNIKHTFSTAGVFNVTNISNINGTVFHINKLVTIEPDAGIEAGGIKLVPPPGIYDYKDPTLPVKIKTFSKYASIGYNFDNLEHFTPYRAVSGVPLPLGDTTIFYTVNFHPTIVWGSGRYLIVNFNTSADIHYYTSGVTAMAGNTPVSTDTWFVYFNNYNPYRLVWNYGYGNDNIYADETLVLNGDEGVSTPYNIVYHLQTDVTSFPVTGNPHVANGWYNHQAYDAHLIVDKQLPTTHIIPTDGATVTDLTHVVIVPDKDWGLIQLITYEISASISGSGGTPLAKTYESGIFTPSLSAIGLNFEEIFSIPREEYDYGDFVYNFSVSSYATDVFSRTASAVYGYTLDVVGPEITWQMIEEPVMSWGYYTPPTIDWRYDNVPTIITFTSESLTTDNIINITSFTATENPFGYMVKTVNVPPNKNDSGWSTTPVTGVPIISHL
jgi:hypothetical protein